MKSYITIMLNQWSVVLQYRWNMVVQLFIQCGSLLISIMTWRAIYANTPQDAVGSYTLRSMIVYLCLTHISLLLFSTESIVRIGQLVRSGKLTWLLLRPYSLLGEYMATLVGQKLFYLVVYAMMIGLKWWLGTSVSYIAVLGIYSVAIFVMYVLLMACLSNIGFWLVQVWPLRSIMNAVYMILGGVLFPLHMLPATVASVLAKLPFALVGYVYANALQDQLTVRQLSIQIGYVIVWIVLLGIGYLVSMKKGLKRYEGVGM